MSKLNTSVTSKLFNKKTTGLLIERERVSQLFTIMNPEIYGASDVRYAFYPKFDKIDILYISGRGEEVCDSINVHEYSKKRVNKWTDCTLFEMAEDLYKVNTLLYQQLWKTKDEFPIGFSGIFDKTEETMEKVSWQLEHPGIRLAEFKEFDELEIMLTAEKVMRNLQHKLMSYVNFKQLNPDKPYFD